MNDPILKTARNKSLFKMQKNTDSLFKKHEDDKFKAVRVGPAFLTMQF